MNTRSGIAQGHGRSCRPWHVSIMVAWPVDRAKANHRAMCETSSQLGLLSLAYKSLLAFVNTELFQPLSGNSKVTLTVSIQRLAVYCRQRQSCNNYNPKIDKCYSKGDGGISHSCRTYHSDSSHFLTYAVAPALSPGG